LELWRVAGNIYCKDQLVAIHATFTSLLAQALQNFHISITLTLLNACLLARFEVLTAVALKNVVFWDVKPQVLPHRIHITSPLQSTAG
jgi:hypothetical protein